MLADTFLPSGYPVDVAGRRRHQVLRPVRGRAFTRTVPAPPVRGGRDTGPEPGQEALVRPRRPVLPGRARVPRAAAGISAARAERPAGPASRSAAPASGRPASGH